MVFYPAVFSEEEERPVRHMVAVCEAVPFGKQPVVELSSGLVVGYSGVDTSTLKAGPGWNGATGGVGPRGLADATEDSRPWPGDLDLCG